MARDRYLYKEWLAMSQKQREALYLKALDGDKVSLSQFRKISTSIRMETNFRLRSLQQGGKDYGKQYDNLMYYLEIEHNITRVPTLRELNNDVDEMMTVNEQAAKFLRSNYSDISYRRYVDRIRVRNLELKFSMENGLDRNIFEGYTEKQKQAFLKWLDTEQASFALDEYGTSDEIIVILADAYHEASKTTNGIRTLNTALAEFEAGDINFNQAMQKVGVSISDRHASRYRAWMGKLEGKNNGHYAR